MRRPGRRLTDAGLRGDDLGNEGLIAPRGPEHTPLAAPKTPIPENQRTESGIPNGENTPPDPDLAKIVAAWPQLPEAVRSMVLAIVQNAIG